MSVLTGRSCGELFRLLLLRVRFWIFGMVTHARRFMSLRWLWSQSLGPWRSRDVILNSNDDLTPRPALKSPGALEGKTRD